MKKIFYILTSIALIGAISLFFIINFIAEQSVAHIIKKINEESDSKLAYNSLDCNVFSGSINVSDIIINYKDAEWSVEAAAIKDFDYFNQPPHSVGVTVQDLVVPMNILPAKDKIILAAHGVDPLKMNLSMNNQYTPDTLDYNLTLKLVVDKMMSYDVTLSLGNLTEKNYREFFNAIADSEPTLVILSKISNAQLKSVNLTFTNENGLEVISKINGVEISTAEKRTQIAQRIDLMLTQIKQKAKIDLNSSKYTDFNRVVNDLKQVIQHKNKFTLTFIPNNKTITELMSTIISLKQQSNHESMNRMNQLCKFISLTY